MRQNWLKAARIAAWAWTVTVGAGSASSPVWAEGPHVHNPNWFSGTYLDPALQRHDLLPHTITSRIPEHREVYNRPRYWTGKLVHCIEPSSQEAMAWETNVRNGNYRRHAGPYVPLYYYPKPWEALNTAARPGFTDRSESVSPSSVAPPVMEAVTPNIP